MSNFNHYPDMDHDGDHDLKDSGMFHDMMDEEDAEYERQRNHHNPNEILPRDLTPEQRQRLREQQQVEDVTKWILIAICAILLWICLNNLNVFTFFLGIASFTGIIRLLTL